jgi:hypothetical protein
MTQSAKIHSLALRLSERKECNDALENELEEISKTADWYMSVIREIQECLECPITKDILTDPYISIHGLTYEKSAITVWLDKHHTCPNTRNPTTRDEIFPNIVVKHICDLVQDLNL